MRIGLIAPPFIPIPPKQYGGTELFVAQLAIGLKAEGLDVVVYCNGESTLPVQRKCLYAESEWPISGEIFGNLKDINHSSWAVHDAMQDCDIIHINSAPALAHSRFVRQPLVYTVHHAQEVALQDFYAFYPRVHFVCISKFQCREQRVPNSTVIHHGLDLSLYQLIERKQQYLSFIGRIAPVKGTHLAIEVAKKAGIPLKIAGQIQPIHQSYFDAMVKPHIDGKFIEFIGEADLAAKNELLGNSIAMLFPIQWHEPFGLVMAEAMACGTPVLALPGGSVREVVADGIAGYVCHDTDEMAQRAQRLDLPAREVRRYAEENFSVGRMVEDYIRLYQRLCAPRAKQQGVA
jgi:glycosyltransferase involved in cell wall biosynthesis